MSDSFGGPAKCVQPQRRYTAAWAFCGLPSLMIIVAITVGCSVPVRHKHQPLKQLSSSSAIIPSAVDQDATDQEGPGQGTAHSRTDDTSGAIVPASAEQFISPPSEELPLRSTGNDNDQTATRDDSGSSVLPGESESYDNMTMDEILDFALANHPTLRARRHEVCAARARLVTAGILPNPRFVLDTETPVHDGGRTQFMTRFTFVVPTGDKIRRRESVAKAGIRRARATLSKESELILLEAADAAIEVLYLQELLLLNQQYREAAAERGEIIAELPAFDPNRSELMLIDKVEAEVDTMRAHADIIDTNTRLSAASLRLSRAIGMRAGQPVGVAGELEVQSHLHLLPLQDVLDAARWKLPAVREAQESVSESRNLHSLARADARPDFVIGPSYQGPIGASRDRVGVRFNTDVPLFDKNQGEILETAALVCVNRAMTQAVQLNSLNDVASAYMEISSIHSGMQQQGERLEELVQRTETQIRDRQIRRGISVVQEMEIQQEILILRRRHLELRYRYHRLLTRLVLLIGQQLTIPPTENQETIEILPTEAVSLQPKVSDSDETQRTSFYTEAGLQPEHSALEPN